MKQYAALRAILRPILTGVSPTLCLYVLRIKFDHGTNAVGGILDLYGYKHVSHMSCYKIQVCLGLSKVVLQTQWSFLVHAYEQIRHDGRKLWARGSGVSGVLDSGGAT